MDNVKRGSQPKSRRGWYIAGASVLLACGLYGGAAAYAGSQIPVNTSVHGVNVGSLSPEAARQLLETKLKPMASEPVTLAVGEKTETLKPSKAGLGIDVDATLDGLTGFNLNPATIVERLTGSQSVEPVSTVDEAKLREALAKLAPKFATETAEGKLAFDGAKPKLTKPVTGIEVDLDAAVKTVGAGWFAPANAVELPVTKQEPKVSTKTFEKLLTDTVEPLVSGPVKLTDGTSTASLSPAQLASAASFKNEGDKVTMSLDTDKLIEAAAAGADGFKSTAKDAQIVLSGGAPKVIASQTGKSIDPEGLAEKVLAASQDPDRTAKVALTTVEPELTTAKAKALGVKQEIVHFSTPYPAADTVRTKNLYAGTRRLSGVIVKPGETFSLEKALGPITAANGYYGSGVVVNGFATEAVGGGLSQISTQMYNVGFLAGYDDITHKPHSRWFDRYPAGREATLWEGQVDMQWKNNTPYAVLVEAWVGGGRVHTRLWSTPYWTVTSSSSAKYNFTNPGTERNSASNCKPESGGKQGFSINVTRTRTSAEKTLPAETKSWTYSPWNKVVCEK
ncbi:VanW family protein [Paeniglutamicibacter sp. NPDC012692]|uniref:VanW family protein n=1 Tax=Paeniglutamicibacter sp. NPDC012692 TaxID=3364388 RepID=UPI0036AB25B6